jgi:hypothetical protein
MCQRKTTFAMEHAYSENASAAIFSKGFAMRAEVCDKPHLYG